MVVAFKGCSMQTFLPYVSFSRSAATLDIGRLGKERVEVLQMLKAIKQGELIWRARLNPTTKAVNIYGDIEVVERSISALGLQAKLVPTPWRNHPVTRSWEGHERALCAYGIEVCREWTRRGYKDTCEEKIGAFVTRFPPESAAIPAWLDEAFADKHKGILYRKNQTFYHSFYGYA